jgi:glycosyltransferase involved in cell wall biosynthesis
MRLLALPKSQTVIDDGIEIVRESETPTTEGDRMKIFGIMAVKNEVDIIAHTLQAASEWCDAIYVLDNGSDDGTWELVKRMARENPAIVAHGRSLEPFTDSLRGCLFNAYRDRARTGDWWCRLDADEIYVNSPRAFLAEVTSHDVVWAIHLQYYFTASDLARYEKNPQLYDCSLPPTERYHFYLANASEARFFRHRAGLKWQAGAWPKHCGTVCPKRILVRHYKFRSPTQMQVRVETRATVAQRGGQKFPHWGKKEWRSLVCENAGVHYDSGNGKFIIDEDALPRHTDPLWRATIKNFMHGTGLWP